MTDEPEHGNQNPGTLGGPTSEIIDVLLARVQLRDGSSQWPLGCVQPMPCDMDRGISVEMQDTTAEADEVLAGVHRRLSGPRKILIACQMSDSVREMARARIRARMPELDEDSIREQLIWELYGVRRQR